MFAEPAKILLGINNLPFIVHKSINIKFLIYSAILLIRVLATTLEKTLNRTFLKFETVVNRFFVQF